MLKLTTSLFNHASMRQSPLIFILGVNYRFSSIVLDEFAMPAEGRPINAYGMLGEGQLEARDRAPEAAEMCRWGAESGVKTLVGL
jgi:hypothetical protein